MRDLAFCSGMIATAAIGTLARGEWGITALLVVLAIFFWQEAGRSKP